MFHERLENDIAEVWMDILLCQKRNVSLPTSRALDFISRWVPSNRIWISLPVSEWIELGETMACEVVG